jgi:hypothetical protein
MIGRSLAQRFEHLSRLRPIGGDQTIIIVECACAPGPRELIGQVGSTLSLIFFVNLLSNTVGGTE